jgi:hypothetical protein
MQLAVALALGIVLNSAAVKMLLKTTEYFKHLRKKLPK